MDYTENKLTQELGQQCLGYLTEEARQAFKELLNTQGSYYTNGAFLDFYLAGYIQGKRAERAKKKKSQELEELPTLDTSKLHKLPAEKLPELDTNKLHELDLEDIPELKINNLQN